MIWAVAFALWITLTAGLYLALSRDVLRCVVGLALLVFAWAGLLGPGDTWAYGLICVLSGFALGADLALAAVYALVPLVLKLGAMALLWAWRRRLEPSPSFDDAATAALPGARP